MNTTDVRKYITGLLKKWLPNKITLDKISESEDGILLFDGNEIKGKTVDLTDYAKKTDIPQVPTKTSDLTNDGNGTKPFLTEHQSLTEYAKTINIPTKTSNLTNDGDGTNPYLTEHQSLEEYTKTEDLPKVAKTNDYNDLDNTPQNLSDFTNNIIDGETITVDENGKMSAHLTSDTLAEVIDDEASQDKKTYSSNKINLEIKNVDDKFDNVYTKNASDEVLKKAIGKFIVDNSDGSGQTIQTVSNETPVGTVIAHMGNAAPEHYLICDGKEYNISDYQELANFFEKEFSKKNYFGGNGTTTFAVPDLRGEFLRGTGTNSHMYGGNGSNVGIHQLGTRETMLWNNYSSNQIQTRKTDGGDDDYVLYPDVIYNSSTKALAFKNGTITTSGTTLPSSYISRPTNTSVLYCIKYESTYYMSVMHNDAYISEYYENYSTDEIVIGKWIDGKPIYRKVIKDINIKANTNTLIPIVEPIDSVIYLNGWFCPDDTQISPLPWGRNDMYSIVVDYRKPNIFIAPQSSTINNGFLIFEYTKTTDAPDSFKPSMITNQYTLGELDDTITEADINDIFD